MKKLLMGLLWCLSFCAHAFQPLSPDQAFSFSARDFKQNTVKLQWIIAPGYYLYQERLSFSLLNPPSQTQLAPINLPTGISKQDNILGRYQVYQGTLALPLLILNPSTKPLILQVHYQGCAASGFCYPPITKQVNLSLLAQAATAQISQAESTSQQSIKVIADNAVASQSPAERLLAKHNWLLVILGFLGFGVLLSFTPCVFPLLPILSGIIVGQGKQLTSLRAFYLSLTYVIAMAITYAIAGIIAALAGSYIQAFFQNPIIISLFSAMFVLLALSLFGFYEVRLPAQWNQLLMRRNQQQTGGHYIGVAVMGCLSVLIVSPCVSAPLIGALGYIGHSGDVILGAAALFALGLGMGIPLMIVGISAGKWLPKSGPWLIAVKAFLGVLMLGVAIWLLQRIIPAQVQMSLWAALAIMCAVYLGALTFTATQGWSSFWKGIGVILLLYGGALFIGALQGNTNPLQPLTIKTKTASPISPLNFQLIKTPQELQHALARAQQQHKFTLLVFSADWCISCQKIDQDVLGDLQVQAALQNYLLLRADVTRNDAQDKALEKYLAVFAPPTIIFFSPTGQEISAGRIFGETNAIDFLKRLPDKNIF